MRAPSPRRNAKKIKVLQVTHDLQYGGLQRVVADLALNVDSAIFDVSICCLREGGPLEEEVCREGTQVFKITTMPDQPDYFMAWKIFRLLRREAPHIIHTHNTQPFLEGGIAALLASVPVHVHTDHGRQFPDKRRYMIAEMILSYGVDQIVAVSTHLKHDLTLYEKIGADKIQVVINGINGDKYTTTTDRALKKKELGIGSEYPLVFGFVGRLSTEKGLTYLIRAMHMILQDFPNILLLIIGEGELRESLMSEANTLRVSDNIRFLGPRSDVNELLGLLDIFILPSLREGTPLVLLEAMAAGLPLIATDVGGVKDVVHDGKNGFLVRPADVSSLHTAMRSLILASHLRESFSRASANLFDSMFTLKKMIQEYELIYKGCLASKGFQMDWLL